MRTIRFTLDSRSIAQAIKEVEQYKTDFQNAIQALVEQMTRDGETIAKLQVIALGAFDTGELEASIYGYYSPSLHAGVVRAGADYAVFVEYGTGVVGMTNQHPAPVNWTYDVNNHGESGWVYKSDRDGNFHWTKGQISHPFMYNTYRELQRLFPSMVSQNFSNL